MFGIRPVRHSPASLEGRPSVEETEKAATAVAGDLKAKGLKRVYLGPENADGDRDVFRPSQSAKKDKDIGA